MALRNLVALIVAVAGLAAPGSVGAPSGCPLLCVEMPAWQAVHRVQFHIALESVFAIEEESLEGDRRFEGVPERLP